MNDRPTASKPSQKLNLYLFLNVILVLAILATIPLIRTGQDNYEPHAVVDREYVKQVIATGQQDHVNSALKLTEISRAVAYHDYVNMLTVMQVVAVLLAIMVVGNILILSRMRQQATPASSPAGQ